MQKMSLTQRFVERVKPTSTPQEFYDSKVSTLYLRVYPSGKRIFFVRFQHKGLRQNHKIGSIDECSLREARQEALRVIHEVRSPTAETLPPITLKDFAQEFFKRYPRHWKPRTLAKNESAFRLYIAPYLEDRKVLSIERHDVEQWFAKLTHVKGSANQALVLLSVMMQQCETWGYRPKNTNPCRNFKRYKGGEVERYLSKDELRRLWQVLDRCEKKHPTEVMIIRLLIYTGCRSSEVRTLQWKEYRGGHWHLSDSKTGAKTVYLSSQVRAYLDGWQSGSDYVFPAPCLTQPISERKLGALWCQVRQLAELDGVRLHDLRHTYASLAIQSKVNLMVLSRLLGHADPETTLKYAHLGREDVCQAASRVSGVLAKGMRS
ncbi:tyrosine-type recombinase/integrase [Vibrio mediterranei]|uniref:tyrosine-type recombinase/integrase n=1 Tax=Vibrio mediterranei TaxID=689 RepID=UPI00148B995E|nr:site-specific integrase [Vibrio mediterranei]NOI26113.1 tyrosine-type recombinase/integrase [Vibrio mediterranei]